MIKEVLIVFKTHLDIGFTDYSENVINNYIENFIPNAIKTGYELKDTKTPFIWTVGSWLIWEGLKRDSDGKLAKAIEDGIIAWHSLAFTSHTELMSEKLFDYSLSLSDKLDERFGKKTIGAKMTDVPGHTIGMIPYMKKHGVEFLHIGVNPATPTPEVPPVFRWKTGNDELIVMYGNGYGKNEEFDDFAICFGHTADNHGAQSPDEIKKLYADLQKKYPGATVKAATLCDVAEKMKTLKNLPVIYDEIGDTWIHGAGTDPKKLAEYRELLRYIDDKDLTDIDLADNLLLIPEHTWGVNLHKFFNVTDIWYNKDFEKTEGREDRVAFEKSWEEQRSYLRKAEKVLNTTCSYSPSEPDLAGLKKVSVPERLDFELSWQLFDTDDYQRYMDKYITFTPMNIGWACSDFIKLGLPVYEGGIFSAKATECYTNNSKTVYKLEFDKTLTEEYGLPYLWAVEDGENFTVSWFGKKASRLPQAFWLKFYGHDENWQVSKMGKWIDPEKVIGSPLIMATDKGIKNLNAHIEPLDSVLLAPFGRRLLDFEKYPKGQDMYFNLYNNIWNTNFPMWYSDDSTFRFIKKTY